MAIKTPKSTPIPSTIATILTDHDLAHHALGTVVPHDALASLTEKAHGSLTGVTADQHHAQDHAARHIDGGADEITSPLDKAALNNRDRLQVGTGTTNGEGDATITFPTAFSAVPKVFLQGVDAGSKGIVLDVVSVSTSQAVVKARQTTGLTSGSRAAHSHTAFTTGSGVLATINVAVRVTRGSGTVMGDIGAPSGSAIFNKTCTTSSDNAHAHAVSATVLATNFNWLAVLV